MENYYCFLLFPSLFVRLSNSTLKNSQWGIFSTYLFIRLSPFTNCQYRCNHFSTAITFSKSRIGNNYFLRGLSFNENDLSCGLMSLWLKRKIDEIVLKESHWEMHVVTSPSLAAEFSPSMPLASHSLKSERTASLFSQTNRDFVFPPRIELVLDDTEGLFRGYLLNRCILDRILHFVFA